MSPLPLVAAGAMKVATAKSMTKAFTMMGKVDWMSVNDAMVSMKDFASSASIIQETLGDIKDQAKALVDIALGTAMSQLAIEFNKVFVLLEPLATGVDKLVVALEGWGVKVFDTSKLILDSKDPLNDAEKALRDWWMTFWNSINPDLWPLPDETARRIVSRGEAQITALEESY